VGAGGGGGWGGGSGGGAVVRVAVRAEATRRRLTHRPRVQGSFTLLLLTVTVSKLLLTVMVAAYFFAAYGCSLKKGRLYIHSQPTCDRGWSRSWSVSTRRGCCPFQHYLDCRHAESSRSLHYGSRPRELTTFREITTFRGSALAPAYLYCTPLTVRRSRSHSHCGAAAGRQHAAKCASTSVPY
jgi:hypothetical protein